MQLDTRLRRRGVDEEAECVVWTFPFLYQLTCTLSRVNSTINFMPSKQDLDGPCGKP